MNIFISSTFDDLIDYRETVHTAIRRLQNHGEDMIYWSADERTALAVSIERVSSSDLLILVLAHRYGTVPPGEERSFVEAEYDEARKRNIPVLAFFIEPMHPWPPPYIDPAPLAEKLAAFKTRIGQECVRQFFRTTESLAVLVTEALANFDRQRIEIPEPAALGHDALVLVQPRYDLVRRANARVVIGKGPDGLPLLLGVKRSQSLDSMLSRIAKLLEREKTAAPLDGISRVLVEEGERIWRNKGIWKIPVDSGAMPSCYVSYKSLSTLFAPSLLALTIPLPSGYQQNEVRDFRNRSTEQTTQASILVSRFGPDERVQSIGGENRFIALSLDNDETYVAGWRPGGAKHRGAPQSWRTFIEESMHGFSECRFVITRHRSPDLSEDIFRGVLAEYPHALSRALSATRYDERVRYSIVFSASRRALAEIVLRIADQLRGIHSSGRIHGDIKPHNILLTECGPVLIDMLSLSIGELSPALSPGWAAPEQVAVQPVSAATDIYPLGLMLTRLLNASLTGEVAEYVIPEKRDGRGPNKIGLLKNPRIYMAPENDVVARRSRIPWLDFTERCLLFDQKQRISSIDDFTEGLQSLLLVHPLTGYVDFTLTQPVQLARLPDGSELPCRIADDDWSPYYAT
ncbi:DUF4062 domain-containing protein [Sorangium atrum]|uniref:DUF4062 domain-containing protein n=1 Tax=Sorangium atrum TaxID=2995308 RepID=A0ABT5C557_9BACT|nr:DUF4062 domain-containing protein [Sorangium aterium]MDC0681545.1 DUF4062 domain-containing protein [Sorangium aterium]